MWTDPQFHTSYPTTDFGKGNLEQMGIDGFFKSHKCNSICEFLGIGKVKFSASIRDAQMSFAHISTRYNV